MTCPHCQGGKWIYDRMTRMWSACQCMTAIREAGPETRPTSDFGPGFGPFVLRVMRSPRPSLVLGEFPDLRDAANTSIVTARRIDVSARLWTVEDIVDAWFDREKKAAVIERASTIAFVAILCGCESPHKWNGTCLASIVGKRRTARLPTTIFSSGDPAALYGERGEECFRGVVNRAIYEIPKKDQDE